MLNLIKADFYRLFNRPYLYVFWGILLFISAGFSTLLMQLSAQNMLNTSLVALIIPVFLWPVLINIVTGEEFKENTIRNTIAFGTSKTTIFLEKVVVSTILAVITVLVAVAASVGCAFLLCAHGELPPAAFLAGYFLTVLSALPLFIAAIIIGTLINFLIQKKSLSIFVYLSLFVFVDPILSVLRILVSNKLAVICNALITKQIIILIGLHMVEIKTFHISGNIFLGGNASHEQLMTAAATGFVYCIVFTVAGAMIFRKWELK